MQAMAQADMAREGLKRIHKEPRAEVASSEIISGNAMLCNLGLVQG